MAENSGYGEALTNLSILGALILSLDFVNLFLMLLRLLGRRSRAPVDRKAFHPTGRSPVRRFAPGGGAFFRG